MKLRKNKSTLWVATLLTISAWTLSSSLALAAPRKITPVGSDKISKDLKGQNPSDMVDVIVQFNRVPTAADHQKILDRGGKLKRKLGNFKGGAYSIPASELKDLASDPSVVYIASDRPVRGSATGTWMLDYHNETINAAKAWTQGLNGTGIGVAVIDSGIAAVSDITANNVVYSQDFTGSGSTADQYGHGTHVGGIIAGNGSSSTGPTDTYTFQGIAQNASLVNLKVLDQNGEGTDSEVIAAIQTAIQLKNTYNIRVINLSVGRPVLESYALDPLCQAVEQAWNAGIVVVVAAGNYGRDDNAGTFGYGTITAPGNDPYVITVGAMNTLGTPTRTDDIPASYSSKGPSIADQVVKPDLVAPGNLIISLYTAPDTLNVENPNHEISTSLYQKNGTATSSAYFILSGTSMATPMVSATAALMLQQNAALTPDQVKARLMLSAFKNLVQSATVTDPTTGQTFNEQADIFTVGAGYLDIQAALASTVLAPPTAGSAMSPTASITASGNVVLQSGSGSVLGTGPVLWSAASVWGDSALGGTDPLTGDAILWGTGSLTGDAILWGTGTLTGDAILWGTDSLAGEAILWGTSASGNDVVKKLWGNRSTQIEANSVLWGTRR